MPRTGAVRIRSQAGCGMEGVHWEGFPQEAREIRAWKGGSTLLGDEGEEGHSRQEERHRLGRRGQHFQYDHRRSWHLGLPSDPVSSWTGIYPTFME